MKQVESGNLKEILEAYSGRKNMEAEAQQCRPQQTPDDKATVNPERDPAHTQLQALPLSSSFGPDLTSSLRKIIRSDLSVAPRFVPPRSVAPRQIRIDRSRTLTPLTAHHMMASMVARECDLSSPLASSSCFMVGRAAHRPLVEPPAPEGLFSSFSTYRRPYRPPASMGGRRDKEEIISDISKLYKTLSGERAKALSERMHQSQVDSNALKMIERGFLTLSTYQCRFLLKEKWIARIADRMVAHSQPAWAADLLVFLAAADMLTDELEEKIGAYENHFQRTPGWCLNCALWTYLKEAGLFTSDNVNRLLEPDCNGLLLIVEGISKYWKDLAEATLLSETVFEKILDIAKCSEGQLASLAEQMGEYVATLLAEEKESPVCRFKR